MALSKKTVNTHNLKRADVFAANGLGNHDVRYAHPAFQGYGHAECILCGKQNLKWLFAIKFDAPDLTVALGKVATGLIRTDEVTLSVVGSKCITDWLDAVPDSIEKLEALKRWDKEMGKLKEAKKLKVCEDLCAELAEARGWEIPEDSTARKVVNTHYYKTGWNARTALPYQERRRFAKTSTKVLYGTCVRKTAQTWIVNLELVLDQQAKIDAAKVAPANKPDDANPAAAEIEEMDDDLLDMKDPDEAKLILRGRKAWTAWNQDEDPDKLNEWERTTFTDIGTKVVKYRSFAKHGNGSSPQQKLYEKLLAKLEKVETEEPETVVTGSTAFPGSFTYTSLSGISGARY